MITQQQKRRNRTDRMLARFKNMSVQKCRDETAVTFQKMIRMEAADKKGDCECVTCGKVIDWKIANAGHFYGRRHTGTLLDELNVHVQCVACNHYRDGNLTEYTRFMQETYSESELDDLQKRHFVHKIFTRIELVELRIEYMDRCKSQEMKVAGGEF
jgi:hypothetical protein